MIAEETLGRLFFWCIVLGLPLAFIMLYYAWMYAQEKMDESIMLEKRYEDEGG